MSGLLDTVQALAGTLKLKGMGVIDSLFPPEKRAELWARLQTFVVNNPKLSAFLLTNFALTGLPLIMFIVFTVTVFVFSLVAALLIGILVALLFTAFMVGVALLVVLPTVFLTTMGASFLFLWGLGGYYIFKWFNKGGEGPLPEGSAIGDKLNSLTGGRLDFLMDPIRKQEAQREKKEEQHEKANGHPRKLEKKNDMANAAKDNVGNVTNKVTKTANVDEVTKKTDGVTKTANNTLGTAKGLVGGATGLT